MSMRDSLLNKNLKEHNCTINHDTQTVKFCVDNDCFEKKYPRLSFNSLESHFIAKNKPKTIDILKSYNIPTPDYVMIDRLGYQKINPRGYPVVLKPLDGMQGKDVYTDIENKSQFAIIRDDLLTRYEKIMMENQVFGENYRVFVFNNKVMDVIERKRPFIVTDGIHTIQELINMRNEKQLKEGNYPTKNIHQVTLQKQGVNLQSIPPENQKIYITNTINYHNGADPVRIPLDKIPEKNLELFVRAHKAIGLECSGIDYMSPDITVPYDINKGHIIEVNDMVDTKIHVVADNRSNPNLLFQNIAKSYKEEFLSKKDKNGKKKNVNYKY